MFTHKEYTACSKCGKFYTAGSLELQFEGWGRRTLTPKGWHSQSDIKRVSFGVEVAVCAACGGGQKEAQYEVPLWKQAAAAWDGVSGDLLALKGRRGTKK